MDKTAPDLEVANLPTPSLQVILTTQLGMPNE
jgi:hypothetical protein